MPDDPWIAYHDARAAAAELDVLERAVAAGAASARLGGRPARRSATSPGQVGGARAVWLIRSFVAAGPDGEPDVNRPPDDALRRRAGVPARRRPARDAAGLARPRPGPTPVVVLRLHVDPRRLSLEPPDPRRRRATLVGGLATRRSPPGSRATIALDGDPTRHRRARRHRALRARAGRPVRRPPRRRLARRAGARHPDEHRAGRARGERSPTDPAAWWDVLRSDAGETARLVSLALTGDAELLGNLPGPDEPHRSYGASIVAGLWPALWGFAGSDAWAIVPGTAEAAAAWAPEALAPEGAFPTLRIGSQPYGLLPATALARWRPAGDDPALEAGMLGPLQRLRDLWRHAAEGRGTVVGADTQALLDAARPRADRAGLPPSARDARSSCGGSRCCCSASGRAGTSSTARGSSATPWRASSAWTRRAATAAARRPSASRCRSCARATLPEGRRVGDTIELLVSSR